MVFSLTTAGTGLAQTLPVLTGNIAIHDPSVIEMGGQFASFATGVENAADGGTPRTKTSADGLVWEEAGPLPGGIPDWITRELGYVPKNLWAPSVARYGGMTYLYYSASSFGRNDSLIALATNPDFDVTNPAAGWTHIGIVIRSHAADNFNAIDPFRIDTSDGRAWLAFGSHWNGIMLIELDPASGLRLGDAPPLPIASRGGGAIEAPAIVYRHPWYYLFTSFDRCCNGIASTYRIMVGRSEDIAGPYLDRSGVPLLDGGGTELLASAGRMRGPGGQETFMVGDEPWLAWHYYDLRQGGVPKLQLGRLHFDQAGWPFLDPVPED